MASERASKRATKRGAYLHLLVLARARARDHDKDDSLMKVAIPVPVCWRHGSRVDIIGSPDGRANRSVI